MNPKKAERPNVGEILGTLKDFQRDTVEYVFRRMYEDDDAVSKFLIADEVGLGKTLVARGLIAKVVDKLWDQTERIDVIYICSNQDIAQQNIDRLNITHDRQFQYASRATLLPITISQLKANKLNFVSLTPGTSFDLRSRTGRAWERIVIYHMLRKAWETPDGVLKNVLSAGVKKRNWNNDIAYFRRNVSLDTGMLQAFQKEMDKLPQLRSNYEEFAQAIGNRRKNVPNDLARVRDRWIGELRRVLARTSLGELEPDLVILDEFQRFKRLLDEDDDMATLAKELFDFRDPQTDQKAKVLLLSATPYKMYTIQGESEDNHFADFLRTAAFLLQELPGKKAELDTAIDNFRKAFIRLPHDHDSRAALLDAKHTVEETLRKVMVRTERLAVSESRGGMLVEFHTGMDRVEPQDLAAYVHLDAISRELGVEEQLEYWKSSAYPLNLMDGYKLKKEFQKALLSKDGCYRSIKAAQPYLLDWKTIQAYEGLDPYNARLRALLEESIATGNWRLLWLPPSLPYYRPNWDSPYAALSSDKGKTKSLIFSSWRIVPKVISVLLSYEAERRVLAGKSEEIQYDELTRKKRGLLRFAQNKGLLTGMPLFCLLYPCITLAAQIDPLLAFQDFEGEEPGSFFVALKAKQKIQQLLNEAANKIAISTSGRVDERWYWVALLLLDRQFHKNEITSWFSEDDEGQSWSKLITPGSDDDKDSWFTEHVREFKEMFRKRKIHLGRKPDDLVEVLARVALAGPAVTSLRALQRVAPTGHTTPAILYSAANVGMAFRKLFNQPDTTVLLQSLFPEHDYWKAVLQYCLDGNLQAVLDEYCHVLNESIGVFGHNPDEGVRKIAEKISVALSLNAQRNGFDDIQFDHETRTVLPPEIHLVRCRYAVRFGSENKQELDAATPDSNIREAFNSPFRPFVLATTSIGQEGLDFHQYCHRIVHWNLPSNPVDLEQREGRIHRYKSHVIRRNIASSYGLAGVLASMDGRPDPWEILLELASEEREEFENELVPFWVYHRGKNRIERHVPMMPMSREIGKLKRLKNSLVVYRSVIGQSRQEEMLAYLEENMSGEDIERLISEIVVDLSPPSSQVSSY